MRCLLVPLICLALALGGGCSREQASAPVSSRPAAPAAVANASVTLTITGMTCEGCVGHVQEALAGTPGVASATVSLAQRQAVVGYDTARVQPEALIAAVVKAGYQASVAPLSAASAASHAVPLPAGESATPAAQ